MQRRDVLLSAIAAATVGAAARARAAGAAPAAPAHPSPPTVRTRDGVGLFVRDWGEGRPMLFVHSWAMSSPMWAYQVADLSDQGLRCVAYDRRGHGRSDVPAGGYDMDTFADDLAEVIEQLGLRDVVLVGHSMGCGEILRYVARHGSARVTKIAFLAPATPFALQTADNPHGAPMAYFEQMWAAWAKDFPRWVEENKGPFFTPETSPQMVDWLIRMLLETPAPVAIATSRAMVTTDLRGDLAKIDRPVLILQGDMDASAPLELTGRPTAAGIRGAVLKVYPGAPHGLFLTQMDQVNRDLLAFSRA
jgi:pimeloyl-ACP methyl ester carboxylesterase